MDSRLGKHGVHVTILFQEAVEILATSRGTINDRLLDAGKKLIEEMIEDGLPTVDGVDEDIRWILARLTRAGDKKRIRSVVADSIAGIKDGPRIAKRIFDAWFKLNRCTTEWHAQNPLPRASHPRRARHNLA